MYLFGFPEGLAGGSKETNYSTSWQTNHGTAYTTSRSTTKTAGRNTSKSTVKPVTTYPVLYASGEEVINTGTMPKANAYAIFNNSYQFTMRYRNGSGGWSSGGSIIVTKPNTDSYLHPDNVGVYHIDGEWEFAVMEYSGTRFHFLIAIRRKRKWSIMYDAVNAYTTYQNRNTAWHTSWSYAGSTSWGTSGFTHYQTNQLTNHITYG